MPVPVFAISDIPTKRAISALSASLASSDERTAALARKVSDLRSSVERLSTGGASQGGGGSEPSGGASQAISELQRAFVELQSAVSARLDAFAEEIAGLEGRVSALEERSFRLEVRSTGSIGAVSAGFSREVDVSAGERLLGVVGFNTGHGGSSLAHLTQEAGAVAGYVNNGPTDAGFYANVLVAVPNYQSPQGE